MHQIIHVTLIFSIVLGQSSAIGWEQNKYDVILGRIEKVFHNNSIFNYFNAVSFKRDRQRFAFNVTTDLKIRVDETSGVFLRIEVYKQSTNNDYRLKLFSFNFNFCDLLKSKFLNVLELHDKDYKPIAGCPLNPGFLQAYNQKVTAVNFPPNIPSGAYQLHVLLLLGKEIKALDIKIYGEVVYKTKQ